MIKLITSLILHLFIAVSEAVVLWRFVRKEGTRVFIFYTTDSNLFAMIVSVLYAVFAIKALTGGIGLGDVASSGLLSALQMLRFMAATGLTITFLVVVFVLSRAEECGGLKHLLLDDSMLFTHFLCPVASMISFLFLEDTSLLGKNAVFVCLIPTLCYAVLAIVMNLVRRWEGPYPFLKIYENGWKKSLLWIVILPLAFLLIAAGLLALNRLFA